MNTSPQETPIHLSILGIQFSPRFSSAFPNGRLNQLCGAWFKSSGMLAYCQRLVGQQGGSKVTGGKKLTSSSTSITIWIWHEDESQISGGEKCLLSDQRIHKHPTVTQRIRIHSGKNTASKPLRTYTLWHCEHTQKYQNSKQNRQHIRTIPHNHALCPQAKWATENFKVLSGLIIKRKCSTMTKLGFFMVSLCPASAEKLLLNWMSQS